MNIFNIIVSILAVIIVALIVATCVNWVLIWHQKQLIRAIDEESEFLKMEN